MATVYEDEKGKLYVFVKGAPDFTIPVCSKYVNEDGKISNIDEAFLNNLDSAIN